MVVGGDINIFNVIQYKYYIMYNFSWRIQAVLVVGCIWYFWQSRSRKPYRPNGPSVRHRTYGSFKIKLGNRFRMFYTIHANADSDWAHEVVQRFHVYTLNYIIVIMRSTHVNWSNWPGISVVHYGSKPPKTRTGRSQTPKFLTQRYIISGRTHKRDSRGKEARKRILKKTGYVLACWYGYL